MYIVSIISKRDDKAYFNKCGVGFLNKDGSINFKLDIHGDTQFHLKEQSDAKEPEKEQQRGRH